MAKQTINIGAAPNDGTGTPLRTSFDYCNQNFTELYTATGPSGNNIVVPGSATITGDLTVNTNVLKVDSTNDRVGIGTASPATILDIQSAGGLFARIQNTTSTADAYLVAKNTVGEGFFGINATGPYIYTAGSLPITFTTATSERYRIASDGVATWSNVGGVAGTAMTLNSTGLGVGVSPLGRLHIVKTGAGIQDVGYFENSQAAAADVGPRASLLGVGSVAMATIESGWNGAANTDAYFAIRTRGSGAVTERLRIDSTGQVGIGVAPSYKFHALVASGYSGAFKASTAAITGVLIGNTVSDLTVGVDASGNGRVTADTSKYLGLGSNGINDRATLDSAGNFVVGIAAVATTATDGFLYVTGCAGTPTGTPTAKTGRVPLVVDTTNNKLYFYSGGSWVAAN